MPLRLLPLPSNRGLSTMELTLMLLNLRNERRMIIKKRTAVGSRGERPYIRVHGHGDDTPSSLKCEEDLDLDLDFDGWSEEGGEGEGMGKAWVGCETTTTAKTTTTMTTTTMRGVRSRSPPWALASMGWAAATTTAKTKAFASTR